MRSKKPQPHPARQGWTRCAAAALALSALTLAPALAEEPETEAPAAEKQEEETDFLERRIGDNWILSPIIFPIYSPETELALAIGGVATFSTQPQNEDLPRSTIGLFAIPATNGSLGFNADFTGFFFDDRFRVELELDYDDGADNYWGVDYEAAREIGDDEDTTEFQRVAFELPVVLSWRLGRSLFAGINLDLIRMEVDERSPTQETDSHFLADVRLAALRPAGGGRRAVGPDVDGRQLGRSPRLHPGAFP